MALQALVAHHGVLEMAAIVNVGHLGTQPVIEGVLKLIGSSREDLAIAWTHVSVTATSRMSQWEPLSVA